MIDPRSIQLELKNLKLYSGVVDGLIGPASMAAVSQALKNASVNAQGWNDSRKLIAFQQIMLARAGIEVGRADGIAGPRFQYGIELWQNKQRDTIAAPELIAHKPAVWPRQSEMIKFYGQPGTNQTMLVSPYPLYLDWDAKTKISKFSIHEKCHDSALRVMNRVLSHYGPEQINALGLDQFGGCLNVRKMRGGSAWSMHSWGAAIDWDADRNPLRATAKTARFSLFPELHRFLDLWEEEGWTSLGRERDYDWQHVQAARL